MGRNHQLVKYFCWLDEIVTMDIEHLRRAAEQLFFFQSLKNLPPQKSWTFLLWLGYFLSELYRLNPKWPIFWKIWPIKCAGQPLKKKRSVGFNRYMNIPYMLWVIMGLNSHYFHIIVDGHQPFCRGLYTYYNDSLLKVGWVYLQHREFRLRCSTSSHIFPNHLLRRDLRMAPVPQYVAKVLGVSSRSVVAGWISLEWKIAPRWSLVCLVKLTPEKPWKAAIDLLCMPFNCLLYRSFTNSTTNWAIWGRLELGFSCPYAV